MSDQSSPTYDSLPDQTYEDENSKSTESQWDHSTDGNPFNYESRFSTEFTVNRVLGEGGFGCVFDAKNLLDGWNYAVKRIPVFPTDTLEKALRGARAMARLDHPGIVGYKGVWIELPIAGEQFAADQALFERIHPSNWSVRRYPGFTSFLYIQMQANLCSYSLEDWLLRNTQQSSRPLPRMKSWFKQIVAAVAHIHENNLIHRDLHPRNIVFARDDVLKVCDLGTVRGQQMENGEEVSFEGTYIGTEEYMSPEQRNEHNARLEETSKSDVFAYTSKSDVFTLGLILAELCVAMSSQEKSTFFKRCRRGQRNNLIEDSKTAEFVEMLTQVQPKNRPTCSEILGHLFLA